MEGSDLERCRREQAEAASRATRCGGARLGASDWLMEEALILGEWPRLPGQIEDWVRMEHATIRGKK